MLTRREVLTNTLLAAAALLVTPVVAPPKPQPVAPKAGLNQAEQIDLLESYYRAGLEELMRREDAAWLELVCRAANVPQMSLGQA